MIDIKNLQVSIDGKCIIDQLNLTVNAGTVHAIMGPNGSGKSTLAHTIMGSPSCKVNAGCLMVGGIDITGESPEVRARSGIFLSFQHPPSIPGVSVLTFLHEAYVACTGKKQEYAQFVERVERMARLIGLRTELLSRKLNEGFSGGEKKQFEMLQILLLQPKLVILDEIDSGLDIDALRAVTTAFAHIRSENPQLTVIIITHYQRILQYIVPDMVHIMCNGSIVCSGDAMLVHTLEQKGYDAYRNAVR